MEIRIVVAAAAVQCGGTAGLYCRAAAAKVGVTPRGGCSGGGVAAREREVERGGEVG
jgi:hypothetical protein